MRLAGELELEAVELRLGGAELGVRRRAVGARVEVRAARQADPVQPVDQRGDRAEDGIGGITSGRPPAASIARR